MEHNADDRFGTGGDGPSREHAGHADAFGTAGAANTPNFGGPGSSLGDQQRSSRIDAANREDPAPTGASERLQEGREIISERMEGMRNRAESQLDDGMRTTADRMEGIAHRLEDVADSRLSGGGVRARAGEMAHTVADRMESSADYLRQTDAHTLISRLEDQVRERPLEMLLAGVATGWLTGKLLR